MADASRTPPSDRPAAPRTWGDAFAALPTETPDASRWPALAQVAARRAAQARRRRLGLALAAGVCALALLPFALRRGEDRADTGASPRSVASVARTPATMASTPPATTADAAATAIAIAVTTSAASSSTPSSTPSTVATRIATPATGTAHRLARAAHPLHRERARRMPHAPPASPGSGGSDTLDALYATSAQLEGLLALARDTRVDSGPAAALAGGYDADLAAIDAHLAQPALPASEQLRLWQARVDTLERAVGLESQLRALAASGGRLDGALVTID
jgi:hypothetical protein